MTMKFGKLSHDSSESDTHPTVQSIESVTEAILAFRDARDWGQFHSFKNLAAAISIEAGELQEVMLWKTSNEVEAMKNDSAAIKAVSDEIADVCIYSILLAHEFKVDLLNAISNKLADNERKYPVALSKGNSQKYTTLTKDSKEG